MTAEAGAGGAAGRVVAITGAGGVLGAAVARRLGSEPGTSLVLSDVAEQSLAATVAAVDETGAPAATLLADVSDPAQVDAVVALAVERFGRLDVLVSNAGVLAPNGRIHNLSSEDWERSFRVNVLGAVNGIRAAVGVMRPQGSGSIILTASVAGLTAWSHSGPYCATKAAVISAGQGGGGRVRPRRHPGQLRLPGDVPLGHPRRAARVRVWMPSPSGTRSGWGRRGTWSGRTPTWPATNRAGRRARRW